MIKVNGYTAGIVANIVKDKPYIMEQVEDNTTSGASTYTIDEDGTYLIIVSNSYQGARSITLPQGRTAIINQSVEVTDGLRGMTIVVADLLEDDVVTMSATPVTWVAFSKQIYKLTNINVQSVYETKAKNDNSETYSAPASGDYLVVGLCFGRTEAYYRDDTKGSGNGVTRYNTQNTITKIYADKGENIPQLDMYGYDGGGVFYIAIAID